MAQSIKFTIRQDGTVTEEVIGLQKKIPEDLHEELRNFLNSFLGHHKIISPIPEK